MFRLSIIGLLLVNINSPKWNLVQSVERKRGSTIQNIYCQFFRWQTLSIRLQKWIEIMMLRFTGKFVYMLWETFLVLYARGCVNLFAKKSFGLRFKFFNVRCLYHAGSSCEHASSLSVFWETSALRMLLAWMREKKVEEEEEKSEEESYRGLGRHELTISFIDSLVSQVYTVNPLPLCFRSWGEQTQHHFACEAPFDLKIYNEKIFPHEYPARTHTCTRN